MGSDPSERHSDGADRLLARGPTLSDDGERPTGSVHVVHAATIEEARRFAFEEPYWLAGVYASVSVTRFHNARSDSMWDHPRPESGSASSLVMVTWSIRPYSANAAPDSELLTTLAESDPVVFGGLLLSDDGSSSTGLVAAVDAGREDAAGVVAGLGIPSTTISVVSSRWQRGGRHQG